MSTGRSTSKRRRSAAGPPSETDGLTVAIANLASQGFAVFLEVGPHPVLASTIKRCVASREAEPLVLASMRRGDAGLETARFSAAFLYARGFGIDWSRVSTRGPFHPDAGLSLAA